MKSWLTRLSRWLGSQTMNNYRLFITAYFIVTPILLTLGCLTTFLVACRKGSLKGFIVYLGAKALRWAVIVDQLWNVTAGDFLDATMRKKEGYGFGNYDETVSRVLGKNQAKGTLTDAGRALANLLDYKVPNHVEEAAKDN